MGVWSMAMLISGEVVDNDRWLGTLELQIAAPVDFARVVLSRVWVTTAISLLTVGRSPPSRSSASAPFPAYRIPASSPWDSWPPPSPPRAPPR